mgnify:FL=1
MHSDSWGHSFEIRIPHNDTETPFVLGGDYHSLPILDEIPSLSLADFEQSMGSALSKIPEDNNYISETDTENLTEGQSHLIDAALNGTAFEETNHKPSRNLIDAEEFFKARAPLPDNQTSNTAGNMCINTLEYSQGSQASIEISCKT